MLVGNAVWYREAFLRTFIGSLIVTFGMLFSSVKQAEATASPIGVHILHPNELSQAKQLVNTDANLVDDWHYVTIPFTLEDVQNIALWEDFFKQARTQKVIPIVRLATRFSGNSWQIPTRGNIVSQLNSLAGLPWPTEDRYIIIGNEVNHKAEWGGVLDPAGYASTFVFASSWARTQSPAFTVLPAGLDLASPNGAKTMEAFAFLDQMLTAEPELLDYVDVWNSHSYPNPAFSASPQRTGKNSLRGFEHELAYLKQKSGKDFRVMITETGWVDTDATRRWLPEYYEYALRHIWSHPQIIAVTPFVLQGAPGPFERFSFLDENRQPTRQYSALQAALQTILTEHRLLTTLP
ncbi:hypothetical protein KBC79_02945 [Candidatus Woesebacteria bacterium]|nr:hypothetical protein [Candidatus Woesebacteria bacterium]